MAPPDATRRVVSASISPRRASSAEAPAPIRSAAARATPSRIIASPLPVVETAPAPSSAYVPAPMSGESRSEEHTSELQSHSELVCRLLLEKKKIPEEIHCAL